MLARIIVAENIVSENICANSNSGVQWDKASRAWPRPSGLPSVGLEP
jgi:hypothetical protein